jgi:hypothetical protein
MRSHRQRSGQCGDADVPPGLYAARDGPPNAPIGDDPVISLLAAASRPSRPSRISTEKILVNSTTPGNGIPSLFENYRIFEDVERFSLSSLN